MKTLNLVADCLLEMGGGREMFAGVMFVLAGTLVTACTTTKPVREEEGKLLSKKENVVKDDKVFAAKNLSIVNINSEPFINIELDEKNKIDVTYKFENIVVSEKQCSSIYYDKECRFNNPVGFFLAHVFFPLGIIFDSVAWMRPDRQVESKEVKGTRSRVGTELKESTLDSKNLQKRTVRMELPKCSLAIKMALDQEGRLLGEARNLMKRYKNQSCADFGVSNVIIQEPSKKYRFTIEFHELKKIIESLDSQQIAFCKRTIYPEKIENIKNGPHKSLVTEELTLLEPLSNRCSSFNENPLNTSFRSEVSQIHTEIIQKVDKQQKKEEEAAYIASEKRRKDQEERLKNLGMQQIFPDIGLFLVSLPGRPFGTKTQAKAICQKSGMNLLDIEEANTLMSYAANQLQSDFDGASSFLDEGFWYEVQPNMTMSSGRMAQYTGKSMIICIDRYTH